MRSIVCVLLLLQYCAFASDQDKAPPSLQRFLDLEATGDFGDVSATPSEQIDAAMARARSYMTAACTDEDVAAIRSALKQTVEKILNQARQKVKDAEQRLQEKKDKANEGAEAA